MLWMFSFTSFVTHAYGMQFYACIGHALRCVTSNIHATLLIQYTQFEPNTYDVNGEQQHIWISIIIIIVKRRHNIGNNQWTLLAMVVVIVFFNYRRWDWNELPNCRYLIVCFDDKLLGKRASIIFVNILVVFVIVWHELSLCALSSLPSANIFFRIETIKWFNCLKWTTFFFSWHANVVTYSHYSYLDITCYRYRICATKWASFNWVHELHDNANL